MLTRRGAVALATLATLAGACGGSKEPADRSFTGAGSRQVSAEAPSQIDLKWESLGGALGAPTSTVLTISTGLAVYRTYDQGVIVYSDDWGAVAITPRIFQKWLSLAGKLAATGQDLFVYVGVPTKDSTVTEGRELGVLERGAIVVTEATGASFAITGEIYGRWAGASVGWPTADEVTIAWKARKQSFDGGDIYWTSTTGAHSVAGPIRDRWTQLGAQTGVLGYPTAEPADVLVGGAVAGSVARFANGAIYQSAAGAWELTGKILEGYETAYGGPSGWLGFPISGVGTTPTSGGTFNDFQNGIIVRHDVGPYAGTWAFKGLDLHLGYIQPTGRDCVGNLCPDMEVYAVVRVTTSETPERKTRYPSDGHYGGGADINRNVALTSAVHSGFWATVSVHGFDWDPVGDNDDAGWVYARYDVDNLFGIMDTGKHSASEGAEGFEIWLGARNEIPFDSSDFVGNLWWSFDNFGTDYLTYHQYAATFSDVAPGDEWWTHPINKLYFEIYSRSAKPGNCFGMGLESIYAELGRSLWAEPIHRFVDRTQGGAKPSPDIPEEQALIDAVNIKHGYQLGAASLEWRALTYLEGKMHNPKWVFEASLLGHLLGDRPLLTITANYFWEAAHSVRPYRWDSSNPHEWRIYVADPNYPSGKPPTGERYISIDPDENTYSYVPNPEPGYTRYEGGTWTGGRMFYDTFAVLADTPQTPAGQVQSLLNLGVVVAVGDTSRVAQVTDADGRTLYQPGTGLPERWDQLQPPGSGIPGLARIPISGQTADGAPAAEIYYSKADASTHTWAVAPAPGVAAGTLGVWEMSSAKLSAHVELPATPGVPDLVGVAALATPDRRVSVGVPPGGAAKEIDWTVAGARKERWATLRKLKLQPGQTVGVRLAKAGLELRFDNDGPRTTAELVVDAGGGAPAVTVGTIAIPAGDGGSFAFDAPVTTIVLEGGLAGNAGWSLAPFTVTLVSQDFTGQGIAEQQYSLDGKRWSTYTGPFTYAEEGATTLHFRARDLAGNREVARTQDFRIDTRAPALDVWSDAASYVRSSPFVVHVRASDPAPGSGLADVKATLDGVPVVDGQAIDLIWTGLGTHTLAAVATDVAGATTTRSVTFELVASVATLDDEIARLAALGEIATPGIARSLTAHVSGAESAQQARDNPSARNRLEALLREIRAQRGHQITARAADQLAADIRYVIDTLR